MSQFFVTNSDDPHRIVAASPSFQSAYAALRLLKADRIYEDGHTQPTVMIWRDHMTVECRTTKPRGVNYTENA